jgi:deoxyribodipyrimidine photo-lyase
MFTTKIDEIIDQVERIDPKKYAKTRNFIDGAVTYLSPYISRGVISTKFILEKTLAKNHEFYEIEKFVMELAWRDYFQNVWRVKQELIDNDTKQPQPDVGNYAMPKAVLHAETGIEALDNAINGLYETGYVHNHARMYIASVTCNIAKSHWKIPAQWLYYHLLDADWASNALSWQWTAAAFSHKKYYANQENINKYCATDQRGTFLDVPYEDFPEMKIPAVLQALEMPILRTELPKKEPIIIDNSLPALIYNIYNLDPFWKSGEQANRVLLLEPSHFQKYPVSEKTIEFILKLAENIERIQVYVGEFDELKNEHNLSEIFYKEHPTNLHYTGTQAERDWMVPEARGYFPSFFAFWKKIEKPLKLRIQQTK